MPIAMGSPASISIGWEAKPRSFDPRFAADANSQYLEDLIHCSLFRFNKVGGIDPSLAKTYTWQNEKTLQITLRDDFSFTNNQKVDATDVAATFGFFIAKSGELATLAKSSPRLGAFKTIDSIEVNSSNTLTFHFNTIDAAFMQNLTIGILPKSAAKSPEIKMVKDLHTCGPFQLVSRALKSFILRKNKAYPLPTGNIEKVKIRIIADENTRYAKLLKGEVQVIQNSLRKEKFFSLPKSKFNILRSPALKTTYLGFNFKDPLLSKLPIRQAIAHAVDRDKIIKYVLAGLAQKANGLLTPGSEFKSKDLKEYPYDPDKANNLLDSSGYRIKSMDSGMYRFKLTYKTTSDQTRITIAKAIASQLKEVGIKVEVIPLEWSRFKEDVVKGNVQLWSLTWIGFKDPDILRYVFSSEFFPPNGGNRGFFSNSALDDLLSQASRTNQKPKRIKMYNKAQQIVNSQLPYVFLWHEDNIAATTKDVLGYELYADGRYSSIIEAQRKRGMP